MGFGAGGGPDGKGRSTTSGLEPLWRVPAAGDDSKGAPMQIRARMSMSADGYVTTPGGWPAVVADPAFTSGHSHGIKEFQADCEAALMGRTRFEPALGNDFASAGRLPAGKRRRASGQRRGHALPTTTAPTGAQVSVARRQTPNSLYLAALTIVLMVAVTPPATSTTTM
jgi:hypothetical protein